MSALHWIVVAYFALNIVASFYLVERERQPMTLLAAWIAALISGLLMWAVIAG